MTWKQKRLMGKGNPWKNVDAWVKIHGLICVHSQKRDKGVGGGYWRGMSTKTKVDGNGTMRPIA